MEKDTLNKKPSKWTLRFLDLIIDIIVLILAGAVLFLSYLKLGNQYSLLLQLILRFSFLLYFFIFESIWQRTPGKFLTGVKVVSKDGSKPSVWRILGRTLARLIPFDPFSFISANPVGWHDSVSGTYVVPENYSVEDVKSLKVKKTKFWVIAVVGLCWITISSIGVYLFLVHFQTQQNNLIKQSVSPEAVLGQKYSDPKFQFTLYYPAGWQVSIDDNGLPYSVFFIAPDQVGAPNGLRGSVIVNVFPDPSGNNLKVLSDQFKQQMQAVAASSGNQWTVVSENDEAKLGMLPAVSCITTKLRTFDNGATYVKEKSEIFLLIKNGLGYDVEYNNDMYKFDAMKSLAEKIIATLVLK